MSPFYLPYKKLFFRHASNFLNACCKLLYPEELAPHAKYDESVVIGVYKFGQEFFIIGIFWNFLYKYLKTIPAKAA